MATDFSTPTAVPQPAPYQHHAYRKSGNFNDYNTMGSGANTPMNVSPTSPRNTSHLPVHPHHVPQIRPMKPPIYVPAALRRTEKPARQSPPKVDSAVDNTPSWGSDVGFGPPVGEGSTPPVSRISTSDLNSIYENTPLSPIAGPITRNHWQVSKSLQSHFHFPGPWSASTVIPLLSRARHVRPLGASSCYVHPLG